MLTENECRILRELANASLLSKKDISQRCGIAWATVVKLVGRLMEQGYVVASGIDERLDLPGRNATVYALSKTRPVAIGIDVEYSQCRTSIRNLRGDSLYDCSCVTPGFSSVADLNEFLHTQLELAIVFANKKHLVLQGAGIGIPGHLVGAHGVRVPDLGAELSQRAGIPVLVDNNIRCFSAAVARRPAIENSMLIVTIRSGIGLGIVLNGKVYQGETGNAGEIGHFPANPHGRRCRCGKIGCLETEVNKKTLSTALLGLEKGQPDAQAQFDALTVLLGRSLATTMIVLDIRNVLIYAELGKSGEYLQKAVRRVAATILQPKYEFAVVYRDLDPDAYVAGAAQLVLNDYVQ